MNLMKTIRLVWEKILHDDEMRYIETSLMRYINTSLTPTKCNFTKEFVINIIME